MTDTDNSERTNEIIKHLSSEITTHEQLRMAFLQRVMALIYIGPFILISSILIGKTKLTTEWNWGLRWKVIDLGGVYLLLAGCSAVVEKEILDECNEWREIIFDLYNNKRMV